MHPFIHLLCAGHWELRWTGWSSYLWGTGKGSLYLWGSLQDQTYTCQCTARSEFLSLNKIKSSQLSLDRPSVTNGFKQVPFLPYNDGAADRAA